MKKRGSTARVVQFVNNQCHRVPGETTSRSVVYNGYRAWLPKGETPVCIDVFNRSLARLGWRWIYGVRGTVWVDLHFLPL